MRLDFFKQEKFKKRMVRAGKVLLALLVFGVILTFIGVEYSAKPEFCITCHYMQPYYDGWKTSTHNMVSCVDCHYPPGIESELRGKFEALVSVAKYVTGTYGKSRPWVEISDQSCLRSDCHEKRLLQGKVSFGNILFDHTPHLMEMKRGKKLRCTSCHSQIVQRVHMTVTNNTCFLCHFKEVEGEIPLGGCPSCHGAPTSVVEYQGIKFDHKEAVKLGIDCMKCHFDVVQGQGNVSKERCFSCHTEPDRLEKYQDVLLMHMSHVTSHKVDCLRCHEEIKHQMISMAKSIEVDCNSCHPAHHAAQKELFLGTGGKGAEQIPDPMFLMRVSCTGCHISHKGDELKGKTAFASPAACISCHGSNYGQILEEWKRVMSNTLSQISPILNQAESELKTTATKGEAFLRGKALISEAKSNIDLVKEGKGVHNIKYSIHLLEVAHQRLRDGLKALGSKYQVPALTLPSITPKTKCYTCHLGVETKTVSAFGLTFSHQAHLVKANIPCGSCHSNEKVHGELILSKESCTSCHHIKREDCQACHPVQEKFRQGFKLLDYDLIPAPMADLGCKDCHLGIEFQQTARIVRDACVNCHDKDYIQILDEQQQEIKKRMQEIKDLISQSEGKRKLSSEQQKKIDYIQERLDLMEKDKSFGGHNYNLNERMLEDIKGVIKDLGS
jgi:nitrate/TMAO reductase-like tetraheme cytochrome c subunit